MAAALLAELVVPARVAGQEPVSPLQFSFSDPGARSLGFGGAFVALADDATATLANPAGLVQLLRPEVSVELRRWDYATPYTSKGRVEGVPSGYGIDTTAGLQSARSTEAIAGLSFLSLAYPRGRFAFALFRHQLANFSFSSETQGLFGGSSTCCQTRMYDQRASFQLKIASTGVSAAYRVTDSLDVGLGVTRYDVRLRVNATMFLPDGDGVEGFFGPTSFLPGRSLRSESNSIDDTAWGLSGGFLWWISQSWRVGGVYRQGPAARIEAEIRAGAAGDQGVPPGEVLFHASGPLIGIPSLLGLGTAYRAPGDRLTLTFQWDRIDYSRITRNLDGRTVDDVEELHLGCEWAFLRRRPVIALRVGAWLDPDHQIRASDGDAFERALLPRGKAELHTSAGLGVAFERFQLDLGIDVADRLTTVSMSAIYSF